MPVYLVALSVHVPDDVVEKYTDTHPEEWDWDYLLNPKNVIEAGNPRTDVSLLRVEVVSNDT